MARQELPPPDLDDWFSEPDVGRRGAGAASSEEGADDDWLAGGKPRRPAGHPRWQPRRLTRRQGLVAGVAGAVALLLIGLAAAGVFSSGSQPAPTTAATTPPATVPTTSTTPSSPRVASAPAATLKPGDTGVQVRRLQRALSAAGYDAGRADGTYGPATEKAVKALQTASSLTADGVYGSKSQAALEQALGKSG